MAGSLQRCFEYEYRVYITVCFGSRRLVFPEVLILATRSLSCHGKTYITEKSRLPVSGNIALRRLIPILTVKHRNVQPKELENSTTMVHEFSNLSTFSRQEPKRLPYFPHNLRSCLLISILSDWSHVRLAFSVPAAVEITLVAAL